MNTFLKILFSPFKWSWSLLNFTRKFICNILLVFLIILAVEIYLHIHHAETTFEKGALIINLTGKIVDKPLINTPCHQFLREYLGPANNQLQENSLFELIDKLRQAKNDPNITGMVLSLKNFSGTDQASLQYIGTVLKEFRESGKPIYAIDDHYSQEQYFLASYANKIYLDPQGSVDLHGLAIHNLYYKTLLNNLKINSHIFRVGIYKSAVEPFLRDNMSDNARKTNSRWLNQLWQQYLVTVSSNRKITPQQLFPDIQIILKGLRSVQGNTAQFALNNKLVDEVTPCYKINEDLIKIFGVNNHNKTFNGISIYNYHPITRSQQGKKIAVIFVNGAIIDGQVKAGLVGGDTTAHEIRNARLNDNIKAIILRVNSPGGSVTASEVIRSELYAARTAGKPIVVSMGGIAASGGYWISTPANYIIASNSTLTGSIGIFGVINTIERSLESIGVHSDGIATSPLANVTITKTLPNEFSQMMQLQIENGYHHFISLVAESRHQTLQEIEKIAQGQVWIGKDAVKKKLIDQIGNFDDAVHKAAELAQLKQYQLSWYLNKFSVLDLFFPQTSTSIYALIPPFIQIHLPAAIIQIIKQLTIDLNINFIWNDPQNRYSICFFYQ